MNLQTYLPLCSSPAILFEGIATLDEHRINKAAIFKAENIWQPSFGSPNMGHQAWLSTADLQMLIQHLRSPPASTLACPDHHLCEMRKGQRKWEGAMTKYQLMFGCTVLDTVKPLDPTDRQQTIQLAELMPFFSNTSSFQNHCSSAIFSGGSWAYSERLGGMKVWGIG
jgi:hypothetical protein